MNWMTLTEEIGQETINLANHIINNNLQAKQTMFCDAPTGKGKSHFIKNMLYNYCKDNGYKILYLLPRKVVKDGFIAELQAENKTDIITVRAYQEYEQIEDYDSYEQYLALENKLSFTGFDIIICDECHYFVSDSLFNPYTYKSFERIFKNGADKLRIFMTATPDPIQNVLFETILAHNHADTPKEEMHGLHICKLGGVSPVKDIQFFEGNYNDRKKQVQDIIKLIDKTDDKAIIFCDSKKYAHELYNQYQSNSIFICSLSEESNKYKIDNAASEICKDHDKYLYMLNHNKFKCKYVFCTSALDVGFSIKDRELKHIVCLLQDWNGVVQAVGRKRIQEKDINDRVILYLPYYSNNVIGTKKQKLLSLNFEHWQYLNSNGAKAYMQKYEKIADPAKIVYYKHIGEGACEPAIDRFALHYHKRNLYILSDISSIDSNEQHKDWMLQQFGVPNKRIQAIKERIESDLKPYADSGHKFTRDDKQLLVDIIDYKNRQNGIQYSSITVLNQYLQSINCCYMIVKGYKREHIDGKDSKITTYQIILRQDQ